MAVKPVYLMPGGAASERKTMIEDIRTVLSNSGSTGADVAYVGTANGDNKVFFSFFKRMIMRAGASAVTMAPIAGKRADISAARSILSGADVIFLSGGEVEDGITGLRDAGLDGFLTDLYESGKQFAGASAGAIMMGKHWIHWDVEGDDSTSRLFPCLGFVPYTFDTHGEKEKWVELKCAVSLLGDGAVGHGLASGGFYSADRDGNLKSYRNAPVVYCNKAGEVRQDQGCGDGK